MNEADILDKVRKLLRLSESSNPHEAARAMEAAIRLANQHKLDLAGIDLDPEIEAILHRRFRVGERLSHIHKLTLNVVVAFFNVEVIVSRPDAIFVGTSTDVVIAHYVHGFLSASCRMALAEFERSKRRKPSLTRRHNFCAGFVWGVRHQLSQAQNLIHLEDAKLALVVTAQRQKRQEYAAELVPKTHLLAERKTRRNWTAAMSGFHAGKATSIRTPLTSGKTILQLPATTENQ